MAVWCPRILARVGHPLGVATVALGIVLGASSASAQSSFCPIGITQLPIAGPSLCRPAPEYPSVRWTPDQAISNAQALADSLFGPGVGTVSQLATTVGPAHLGMYTSGSDGGGQPFGDISLTHAKALPVTDSASVLPPGALTPAARDLMAGGGILGFWDMSHGLNLNANQKLVVGGVFDYKSDSITNGPPTGFGPAGNLHRNSYTVAGLFEYDIEQAYVQGIVAGEFGDASETNTTTGGVGSFTSDGVSTDLRIGNVFALFQSAPPAPAYPVKALPVKAPAATPTGNDLYLDLSAHVAYQDHRDGGFTDTAGFTTGTQTIQYGAAGARAKLFEQVQANGLVWEPWVAATIDQQFGYSNVLIIPNQPALIGGDTVFTSQAHTYWGGQGGLEVTNAQGWKAGVKGVYMASADTTIVAGNLYVRIPF